MAMTLAQLRSEIVANHGGITGKDTMINTILNLVQLDLSWNHNWRDLKVTDYANSFAAGVWRIPITSPIFQRIEFLNLKDSDDNFYEVELLPLADFRNLEDGSGTPEPEETQARPTHAHYTTDVSVTPTEYLTFNRRADQNYEAYIDGFIYPTDMTAADDYPSITVADSILITYATAWLYQHRKQPQTAGTWFQMADTFFKSITNEDHGMKYQFTRKRVGI